MSQINIKIDKRTELLYVVGLLADYHRCIEENFTYKINILNYFNKYKKHHVINYFQELTNNYFDYDALATFAIHLNEKTLEIEFPFSEYLISMAGNGNKKKGKIILEEFARLIRLFAFES